MKGMQCDTCNKWCHMKCDFMTVEEYEYFITTNDDDSIGWNCLYCTMKFNNEHFAFTLVEDEEILKINNSDSMRFCEFLPSLGDISETDRYVNIHLQNGNDVDQNISSLLSSKYYSVNAFQQLDTPNNLNIFHSNVNGLESKFDICVIF